MTVNTIEVDVDTRKRVPLKKMLDPSVNRVRIERLSNGELRVTPVITLTQDEIDLLANPERVARIKRGIAASQAGEGTRHTVDELRQNYFDKYGVAPEVDAD